MSLADWLTEDAVSTSAHADDWRDAITLAGERLVATGSTTATYTQEMIETVEKLGPYIVIAPGIALAHSRPSPAVLHTGISWVTLAKPVEFGSADNDPVELVLGLAAIDHDGHVEMMSQLAAAISDDAVRTYLLEAASPAELLDRLRAMDAPADLTEASGSAKGENA